MAFFQSTLQSTLHSYNPPTSSDLHRALTIYYNHCISSTGDSTLPILPVVVRLSEIHHIGVDLRRYFVVTSCVHRPTIRVNPMVVAAMAFPACPLSAAKLRRVYRHLQTIG